MTKLSRKPLLNEQLAEYINNLWAAFTVLDSKEDVRLLFKDLFTHTEYKMLAKRLEIARRLLERYRYEQIEKDLKVTPPTISKISNILSEKGEGLRKVHLKLLQIEEKRRKQNLSDRVRMPRQKTLLGAVLKVGLKKIDSKLRENSRRKSAAKNLSL